MKFLLSLKRDRFQKESLEIQYRKQKTSSLQDCDIGEIKMILKSRDNFAR